MKVIMPGRSQAQKENKRTRVEPFGTEEFRYDKEKDVSICPEGKILKRKGIAFGSQGKISYKARGKDCRECKHFGVCTTGKNGRWIVRVVEQEGLKERLEEIYREEESQRIYKLRKEKAELPFGHYETEFRSRSIYVAGQGKGQRRTFHLINVFQYSKNDHHNWYTNVDCEVE